MKHYTKSRIILRFICLLWGSVSLGLSESAPDDPFPFPPRKATVVDISKDKVFQLQKSLPPLPEKVGPDYILNEDLEGWDVPTLYFVLTFVLSTQIPAPYSL